MKPCEILKQPIGSVEVINKRNETSKTFSLGNGKFRIAKTIGPVHYKNNRNDRNEEWKEIDLTPEDKGNRFEIHQAPYDLEISKEKISISYTSKEGGNIVINLKSIGGILLNQLNLNINPRIENNQIWWDNIVDGLDIYLNLSSASVEYFKVIKSNDAPHELEWDIEEDKNHLLKVNSRHKGTDADKKQVRLEKIIAAIGGTIS